MKQIFGIIFTVVSKNMIFAIPPVRNMLAAAATPGARLAMGPCRDARRSQRRSVPRTSRRSFLVGEAALPARCRFFLEAFRRSFLGSVSYRVLQVSTKSTKIVPVFSSFFELSRFISISSQIFGICQNGAPSLAKSVPAYNTVAELNY